MTMISLDQLRKYREAEQKISAKDLEAGVAKEKLKKKQSSVPLVTVEERIKMLLFGVLCATLVFVLSFIVLRYGPDFSSPNTIHFVSIIAHRASSSHRADGGYDIVLDGNTISEILPNGSSDIRGTLQQGDEILGVNGVPIGELNTNFIELIIAVQSNSVDGVRLELRAPAPPAPDNFLRALIWAAVAATITLVGSCIRVLLQGSGTARVVNITKVNGSIGIEIEYNQICSILPGGPAAVQGELKVGDVIIAINGVRLFMLSHDTIEQLLQTRDFDVKLAIKREE